MSTEYRDVYRDVYTSETIVAWMVGRYVRLVPKWVRLAPNKTDRLWDF